MRTIGVDNVAVVADADAAAAARAKGVETVNAARAALELKLAQAKNALNAANQAYAATQAADQTVTVVVSDVPAGYGTSPALPSSNTHGTEPENKKVDDQTVKLSAATKCFDDYLICAKAAKEDPSRCVETQRSCLSAAVGARRL